MHSILSQNMEAEKQAGARRRMKSTRALALVGSKHIHSPILSSAARPATPYFFLFIFLLFSPFWGFSATVQDIIDKCDSIDNATRNLMSSIQNAKSSITTFRYYYTDSNGQQQSLVFTDINELRYSVSQLDNMAQDVNFISQQVGLIRQLATALESSGGSYDYTDLMAELEEMEELLDSINNGQGDIKELYMDYMGWFTENQDKITNYLDNWGSFTNSLPDSFFYNFVTNIYSVNPSINNFNASLPSFRLNYASKLWLNLEAQNLSFFNPYLNPNNGLFQRNRFVSLSDYLFSIMLNQVAYGGAIQSTLYTNTVNTINSNKQSLKLLSDGFSAVSNSTIRPYIDELYKSPLDEVTSDFYTHLTNSYLSAYSGTNPNTNWFRRVETLLASLVFQGSGHEEDIEEVGEDVDKAKNEQSTLESSFDAENTLSFDFGQQLLDTNFHLPSMGSQFPQTLTIKVPGYGGSGSESEGYTITIDTTKIRSLCELIRACFRMLYLLFLIFVIWAVYKLFIKYLRFIFNLFSGLNP